MISPVAIFVYNRVDNTQQTVQALLRNTLAKETDVYVFSDGGKNEESWKRVNEVRAYLHEVKREVEANGGLRSITLVERPENIYLERNTSTSTKLSVLKKFFKAYGQNPGELVFYLKDQNKDLDAEEAGTRFEIRRRYWAYALEFIKKAHGPEGSFRNVTTSKQYWINGGIGISGFSICCEAKMNKVAVELVLGKSNRDLNKSAYDYLFSRKEEIESKLGIPLNWWRFEGKSSYVDYNIEGIGINDEANWTKMAKFHAEWSKKFYDVFVPLLQQWNIVR